MAAIVDVLAAITDDIGALLDGQGRVMVGVTGPPGAGKSTVARALVGRLDSTAYLPMDGFHLSSAQLDRLGRRDRKGAIDTFDVDGYVAILQRTASSYRRADVYVPDFDRSIEEPVAAGLVVPADARIVITEGNYLGTWEPVRALLHRLYYLDRLASARQSDLVARHVAGGRDRFAAQAYVESVDEANARMIAATRGVADRAFDVDDQRESSA